jgi:hypothetical protein
MPKRWNDRQGFLSPNAIVFALLVLATVAAFAYSQRVKRDPLVLDKVSFVGYPVLEPAEPLRSFTPNDDCQYDRVRIRFRTTVSDEGTVQVIKPGGRVVVTLARDQPLKRYTSHTDCGDGHQRGAVAAAPGRYKLRVRLGSDRTLVTPGAIKLHRAPKGDGSRCASPAGRGGVPPKGQP